ncbi:alpha/beta hydrolase [Mycobacterium hodleri]|uniref:Alpha/beta hydrolase n=1 Tax=Mycolicibacterium hodleri TaxID=49897 RepID=A0A502E5M6_9MYCO|nr:alpha/beta hydrolase [Mycolicibacterium hodleri]
MTFGDIEESARPLAVLVHGFPDTPHTWRHLGPVLTAAGYRVVATWLPGYLAAESGPVSAGTYVRHVLDVRNSHGGDERAVLVGHDWGATAGYGAVVSDPGAFRRFVALAVPPAAALGSGLFGYDQLKRSFYVWFIQQAGLADFAMLEPGFWESLWGDWSPGYDPTQDISMLRRYVTQETIGGVLGPYRASFDPKLIDQGAAAETAATLGVPPVPTYYLHGSRDGAIGAELLGDVISFLSTPGSVFELVDGVGHFLHLERPEVIGSKIVAWLAD